MSEFSELLNHMIRVRGVQASKMAAYCGLERSKMYKILRGTRILADEENLIKIADYLGLNRADTDQLKKSWEKSLYGEEDYYRKQAVIEFLESFHGLTETSGTDGHSFSLPDMKWPDDGSEAGNECETARHCDRHSASVC